MRLRIVGHPARQMQRRQVTRADIESALRSFHTSIAGKPDSITYIGPGVGGADLKVWALPPGFVDEETTVVIKSVAWKDKEDPT